MWEQIRSNQTRSAILVVIMGAFMLLLGYFLGLTISYFFDLNLVTSGIFGMITVLVIWEGISLVAYFQGDSILLALSKAKKIRPDDHPRLFNIVEEIKIASGLETMPSIYIIDDPALNAFATGRGPEKASVAVTSGLLKKLNRDELQGVIGHEMAHIKNLDVQLMILCIALLGTVIILTWYSSRYIFSGGITTRTTYSLDSFEPDSAGCSSSGIIIIILTIWIPIVAQLLYFAISRRREYLADACSALYTRYPEGLASALEKIAASTDRVLSANPATAPIYIVNPFREQDMAASDISSTHPPISERIRILRSMAHVSYTDYDQAYRQIRNIDKGIIPATAMAAAGATLIRAAVAEDLDYIQRARETSNVLWNLNRYKIINCACGTRMRLPPSFKLPEVRCPHCGRINPV